MPSNTWGHSSPWAYTHRRLSFRAYNQRECPLPSAIAPRVDVCFRLTGKLVPRDHGYALFGAIARVLGNLHGAKWLALHPLPGIPRPDGLLLIDGRRGLRLRVEPSEIPRILPLAGKRLEMDGYSVQVGVPSVFPLVPASELRAPLVVIKGFMEPEPFRDAVRRQLDAIEANARVEVGRRRVLTVSKDTVVGFGVTLHELSDEGSLNVQYAGIGGRQRMGCGMFLPARRRARPEGAATG